MIGIGTGLVRVRVRVRTMNKTGIQGYRDTGR